MCIRDSLGTDKVNTVHSKYSLASVMKPFIAVAILQLASKKLLSLKDDVGYILSPSKKKANLNIYELLTHTGGIKKSYKRSIINEKFRHQFMTNVHELLYAISITPRDNIGKFSYSNTGYLLLRQIVEKVSQSSFDNYLSVSYTHLTLPTIYSV